MADDAEKKTINLTDGETKLFISIMKNLETTIDFDADAVAAECGYKNGTVAKGRWRQVKSKKLGLTGEATPGKKRKGGEEAGDGAENGSASPTKKARESKAKKGAKVKEEADKEDDEEGAENW